jgi:molybdopterin molybdotransferase
MTEAEVETCSHPMIPVPHAIDIVLRKIAEASLLEDRTFEELTEVLPVLCEPSSSKPSTTSPLIGRIAAEKIVAPFPGYPPFNASIMDGYAVCSADVLGNNGPVDDDIISFRVVGSVYAGPFRDICHQGSEEIQDTPQGPTAIYVTTGAVVPSPYDCVVPVEDVVLSESKHTQGLINVSLKLVQSKKWIRPVGCDIAPNTILLNKGDVLSCIDLGVLITCGITQIRVRRVPKVGVLSTGNELKMLPHSSQTGAEKSNQHHSRPFPPKEGLVYDINRPVLLTLLATESHVTAIDYGIALDDVKMLEAKVQSALEECDILITSGGISAGEKDLLENLLTKTFGAALHFGRLNMKPGKPTTFFTWRNPERHKSQTKFIFALPGNPVSAFVCFQLIVSPALNLLYFHERGKHEHTVSKLQEENELSLVDDLVQNCIVQQEVIAVITQKLTLDEERPEYHRVSLSWDASNSHFVATSTGVQRSSRVLSLKGADGLLVLPQGLPGVKMHCDPGEKHLCLLLHHQHCVGNAIRGIKWKDSLHRLAFSATPTLQLQQSHQKQISIAVEIFGVCVYSKSAGLIEKIIREGLYTIKSIGEYEIGRLKLFPNSDDFLNFFTDFSPQGELTNANLWIIVSNSRFQEQVELSSSLRSHLEKRADSMAMQARRKMAEKDSLSALFEVLVGWYKRNLVVYLPLSGLETGMQTLKPLIAHALLLSKNE